MPCTFRTHSVDNVAILTDFSPDDLGWTVKHLASPAAKRLNSVLLPVDDGVAESF